MATTGVSLGQLLLALDATMVSLIEAPRGLDRPVASSALIDSDDVRLGLAVAAGSADIFFLLGISDTDALRWIDRQVATRAPTAIFVKEPADAVVARAVAAGTAVVAVEPQARWERLYRIVDHVFEHHGDRADPLYDSSTDLFGLAQSIADRTHGMVSIEDEASHVLAYSASSDEADELRRLSILGRAGPPRASAVAGPVGHLRRTARRGPKWCGWTSARNWDCSRAWRSASISPPPTGAGPRRSRAPSGCSRGHGRWPTTPRRCCAVRRCWPRGSWPAWPQHRRRMPCAFSNWWG